MLALAGKLVLGLRDVPPVASLCFWVLAFGYPLLFEVEGAAMAIALGIIGGGVMGTAILARLLGAGYYAPSQILVSEPMAERRSQLADQFGIGVTADNTEVVQATDALLLAIKPQVFGAVMQGLTSVMTDFPGVVLSILAGTTLANLEQALPGCAVVRAMPNTPATVGVGCTAIAPGRLVGGEQLARAREIFAAVGQVVEVPETLMDAVTGLSGSGPAYVALMVEALADGGVAVGLPRAIAQQLALQTVLGTATLLNETGQHPALLKDQVTSPGGTTIAGIGALEQAGFRSALIEAVKAATRRSQELGG